MRVLIVEDEPFVLIVEDEPFVLIVEDEPFVALELEELLLDEGFEVVECGQCGAAIDLGRRHRPDLALLDLNLADGLTGPRIAKTLVHERLAAVVFVTGQANLLPSDLHGAFGIIEKPCVGRAMVEALRFLSSYLCGKATKTAAPPVLRLASSTLQRPFSVKVSTSSCVSSGVAPSTTGRTNPMVTDLGQARDRHQLQQIIAGLSEGVILIEPGQRIVWGNEAALAMHGVESLKDLGATVDAYRRRFRLRYRNNHILKKSDYPLARAIAGETFSDVTVEVCAAGRDERWVHSIRSQVVTYADGQPDCLVLVITDVTEQYEAEARFESAFNANPAPAAIARLSDRR